MPKQITFPQTFPVTCHTDFVGQGTTFVVVRGFKEDGVAYISSALKKGATTIVVEHGHSISDEIQRFIESHGATLVRVDDARKALAQLSAQAAGNPHEKLTLIAVTGTKGKTTTSTLLFHLLSTRYSSALISTVSNKIGDVAFKAPLTTPQPDYLHQFLKLCVESGVTHVVMEVAAQALSMRRVNGIQFDAIIMTNIEREHLEFYPSMDEYIGAKMALFDYRKPHAQAWLNRDDAVLSALKQDNVRYFSLRNPLADIVGTDMSDTVLKAEICFNGDSFAVECPRLFGVFNIPNICAASGVALSMGISSEQIQAALKNFQGIRGRYEVVPLKNGARAIIDYAHNPVSFEQLFSVLRPQTNHFIVVFGAGGDRDRGRRPIMGGIARRYADAIILTTDNPRSERAEDIVNEIKTGIVQQENIFVELDREKAIRMAYALSKPTSIIAILGKGPDEYQIIGTTVYPFKERDIVRSLG